MQGASENRLSIAKRPSSATLSRNSAKSQSSLAEHRAPQEPRLFCTMPFLPLSVAEPFSVTLGFIELMGCLSGSLYGCSWAFLWGAVGV